jgi:hypothetical protein
MKADIKSKHMCSLGTHTKSQSDDLAAVHEMFFWCPVKYA